MFLKFSTLCNFNAQASIWDFDFQMAITREMFIQNRDFNIPLESAKDELSDYGVSFCTGGPWYML